LNKKTTTKKHTVRTISKSNIKMVGRAKVIYIYIMNLVCYTYFHWLFNPGCQHIFGKQTGIYVRFRSPSFGPQKTITTWLTKTEIFTLH
jgi:hypothetical protein